MIHSIDIHNFQSHQESHLELHPGINTLVGDSDKGKSAVLRSLLWCVTNSPSGDAFVSDWAKTPKGKIKSGEACRVTVKANPGQGCKDITRERSDSFNGYKVFDGDELKTFEALRTDIPEEARNAFNLGPVNIQRQLDPPFLIAETPGEAARIINSLVNLTVIDETLAEASSVARATNAEAKRVEADLADKQKELDSLGWVPELQELATHAKFLEEKLLAKRAWSLSVERELAQEEELAPVAYGLASMVHDIQLTMDCIEQLDKALSAKVKRLNLLEGSLDDLARQPNLRDIPEKAEKALLQAEKLGDHRKTLSRSIADQEATLEAYGKAVTTATGASVEEAEKVISRLERMDMARKGSLDSIASMARSLKDWEELPDPEALDQECLELEDRLSSMACPLCGRTGCSH